MSTTLAIAIACILGSLALIGSALRKPLTDSRHTLRGGLTTLFLGFALLTGELIKGGPVGTITQAVFIAAALLFFVQEGRSLLQRRGTPSE